MNELDRLEDYEHLPEVEKVGLIKAYYNLKGINWLICALIHSSIGYYTFSSAKRHIKDFLRLFNTEKDKKIMHKYVSASERGICLFKWNMLNEMLFDIKQFLYYQSNEPTESKLFIFKMTETQFFDNIEQMTIGLMLPSMNL